MHASLLTLHYGVFNNPPLVKKKKKKNPKKKDEKSLRSLAERKLITPFGALAGSSLRSPRSRAYKRVVEISLVASFLARQDEASTSFAVYTRATSRGHRLAKQVRFIWEFLLAPSLIAEIVSPDNGPPFLPLFGARFQGFKTRFLPFPSSFILFFRFFFFFFFFFFTAGTRRYIRLLRGATPSFSDAEESAEGAH